MTNNPNNCITYLTSSQVAALDPYSQPGNPCASTPGFTAPGPDAALLNFISGRYPSTINDPSGFGDGINTEGFIFTAPAHESDNVYTGRIDYNLAPKHKLFLSGSVARALTDDFFNTSIVQFPGDPAPDSRDHFNSYAISVGETWAPTTNIINQFSAGLVRAILIFPVRPSPTFPNVVTFNANISSPYLSSSSQSRNVPVPEFRDGLAWIKGKHTMDLGTDLKFTRQMSALKNDFNFIGIGLGGNLSSLDASLRPSDIFETATDTSAISDWDNFFPSSDGIRVSSRILTTIKPPRCFQMVPARNATSSITSSSSMPRIPGKSAPI